MNTKLIVALDFEKQNDALALIEQLDPTLCALKVGSEMFTLWGTSFVRQLISKQFKVFLDLKFHDIPNTVAQSCKAAAELGVWMMNVHASGGFEMMSTAVNALESYGTERPLLIAVTVLTSFKQEDLIRIGIEQPLAVHVNKLALLAKDAGLNGVVCSAHEVPTIKTDCGANFITVTPGIRLESNSFDDQSRVMTPKQAIAVGSDYLVVGRPITRAPDPLACVHEILNQIIRP